MQNSHTIRKSPVTSGGLSLDAWVSRTEICDTRGTGIEMSLDAARGSAYATPMPVYLSEQVLGLGACPGRRNGACVERFADLLGQCFQREGLFQEIHAGPEHTLRLDCFGRIARHVENPCLPSQVAQLLRQLPPVCLRHYDVRKKKVNRPRMDARDTDRLLTARRDQ